MSLFLDTGVIVAFANTRDPKHPEALRILDAARRGEWGQVVTSDYVFDETVTLIMARTHRPDAAVRVGEFILGTGPGGRVADLAYVSPRVFLRSWALFSRLAARGLSFTDCTSVELVRSLGLDEIASFDGDFDGIVPRRTDAEEPP